jgi:hypothetical protein
MTDLREPWVIEGGFSSHRDSVTRLHQFQGEHPDVQFASPVMGRYGQYTALIQPGVIPGSIVRSRSRAPTYAGSWISSTTFSARPRRASALAMECSPGFDPPID